MEQAKNASTSATTKKKIKRLSVMNADEAVNCSVKWLKLQFSSQLVEEAMSRYPFENEAQITGTLNEFSQLWKTFIVAPDCNKNPRAAFVSQRSLESYRNIVEKYS
ncbi:hypothetical protein GQ42DRAFT_154798 [Ramicandelaber brevisporus]|nr:hypothetical protein GQ42DRAFT_154798 [Ramicandelaber brevisporus]